jgi:hypothetical protein
MEGRVPGDISMRVRPAEWPQGKERRALAQGNKKAGASRTGAAEDHGCGRMFRLCRKRLSGS